jgi:HlyD family secretion protein
MRESMNTKKLAMWAASLLGLALLAWAARPQPQAVETARPARGYFVRELVEDAQTRVRERYTVSAPLAGQLLRPVLKAGDAVAAGDTVALIEPAPATFLEARSQGEQRERVAAMQATLDRALANQTRARAAERQAQADHARSQSLAEQGFVSSTQLENTALAWQQRQQERLMAERERESAEHDLSRLRIG